MNPSELIYELNMSEYMRGYIDAMREALSDAGLQWPDYILEQWARRAWLAKDIWPNTR